MGAGKMAQIKSMCCSYRGPRFSCRHMSVPSQPPITKDPKDLTPSSDLYRHCAHVYRNTQFKMKTNLFLKSGEVKLCERFYSHLSSYIFQFQLTPLFYPEKLSLTFLSQASHGLGSLSRFPWWCYFIYWLLWYLIVLSLNAAHLSVRHTAAHAIEEYLTQKKQATFIHSMRLLQLNWNWNLHGVQIGL